MADTELERSPASLEVAFEENSCAICGISDGSLILRAYDRFDRQMKRQFQLVRCLKCGLIYLNPRVQGEAIGQFYPKEDYDPFMDLSTRPKDLIQRFYLFFRPYSIRWKRKWVERLVGMGSLLDYGSGTGEFLFEMKRWKWEVVGIEKDAQARRFSQDMLGLHIYESDAFLESGNQRFDAITFWHSLEHLYEPLQVLQKVRECLKEEGVIFVALPNIASIDAFFYGQDWVALDLPRHLWHFTPKTLEKLSRKAGFRVIKKLQMPLDVYYNCLSSEKLRAYRKQRSALWRLLYYSRGALLANISWIVGMLKNGSGMLYCLQKR